MPIFTEIQESELEYLLNDLRILIVTATQIESQNTLSILKPIDGRKAILKVHVKELTLYIGKLGNYSIVQVQCTMGAISRSGSTITVSSIINKFSNIKAVLMVGIAFGLDESECNIGDVLISESIVPYDSKRVGKSETIQRGIELPACKILLDRLRSVCNEISFSFKVEFTKLLSGESLIDNLEFRNELKRVYPNSKGGEMEGAGISAACDSKCSWILIKGICDFADGNKSKNKTENQTRAITSALTVLQELLNSVHGLSALGIIPDKKKLDSNIIKNVLFEVYSNESEDFYSTRTFDKTLEIELNHFSIWVFGSTGMGKTNSILRKLKLNQNNFCQINLALCCNGTIDDYFAEIAYELKNHVTPDAENNYCKTFRDSLKTIKETCKSIGKQNKVYIYIDEIPLGHEQRQLLEFSRKFHFLLLSLVDDESINLVTFILSTISNPSLLGIDDTLHEKFTQFVKILDIGLWNDEEILALNRLIISSIGLNISSSDQMRIIQHSNNSPRMIKKIYRNLIVNDCYSNECLESTLNATRNEYIV
jgi:nucleoside phosphorylase